MRLKNFLIVVKDIERAKRFYHDLFGFEVLVDFDGNMILTDEESDIEAFVEKLERLYPDTKFVNRLITHSWGQTVIRFYDPDGNLIEVGTPV